MNLFTYDDAHAEYERGRAGRPTVFEDLAGREDVEETLRSPEAAQKKSIDDLVDNSVLLRCRRNAYARCVEMLQYLHRHGGVESVSALPAQDDIRGYDLSQLDALGATLGELYFPSHKAD